MLFSTDGQTLSDLGIFGKHGGDSIYNIFNRCVTKGGAAVLADLFRYPLSDYVAINKRVGIIRFFAEKETPFPFDSALFDAIEPYLANTDQRTRLGTQDRSLTQKVSRLIAPDNQTALIYNGVDNLVKLLKSARSFLAIPKTGDTDPYADEIRTIGEIIYHPDFDKFHGARNKLTYTEIADFDVQLRFRHRDIIHKLLRHIYYLDVYISIAGVAKKRGFSFSTALPPQENLVKMQAVYHPQVPNAVGNDITITAESNMLFLTGANMAGKSTFMKSISIAMFLAHMGFPVAARSMEFSVLDGIYTTINLPDNLGMGASHFYAEVLRVKKIANELKQDRRLFIVFDELFRGTNVKDAYDATIAIAKGFAGKRSSMFMISTHIIEAGEVLKGSCPNIRFVYLPTRMNGKQPAYTYTLESGITDDRHGMIIIDNEGILSILGAERKDRLPEAEFIVDKQTMEDLNLLGRFKPGSVYSLFDNVKTRGGQRLLDEMFRQPMKDTSAINQRTRTFRYFQDLALKFPFQHESLMLVESYLAGGGSGNIIASVAGLSRKKLLAGFLRDEQFAQLQAGLAATVDTLKTLVDLLNKVEIPQVRPAKEILTDRRLSWLAAEDDVQNFSVLKMARYDLLLRHTMRKEMDALLACLYRLDVYIAVSDVARQRGFSYAQALPSEERSIRASDLWHPAIENATANAIDANENSNVLFLTGANMAGKSTFMKSFGIAVYLAHMGFPVAARDMSFSVRDGLYTSINVADDLNRGYSHFYAEVLRVKTVAEQVGKGMDLVVIFDELFKGTNVKDAFDATLQVTASLARYRNCFFIVSTHIIEVGETLRNKYDNIKFAFLPTFMDGAVPRYTYRLNQGITVDRHGMVIIANEKILETLGYME